MNSTIPLSAVLELFTFKRHVVVVLTTVDIFTGHDRNYSPTRQATAADRPTAVTGGSRRNDPFQINGTKCEKKAPEKL